MFFENCRNTLPVGSKFCASCGARTEPVQPAFTRPVPPSPLYTPSAQVSHAPYQPPAYSHQPLSEPLRVGQYIGMLLLMVVPILGVILLFVWSFGGSVNLNKKNFARAILIISAIGFVISILFSTALVGVSG